MTAQWSRRDERRWARTQARLEADDRRWQEFAANWEPKEVGRFAKLLIGAAWFVVCVGSFVMVFGGFR